VTSKLSCMESETQRRSRGLAIGYKQICSTRSCLSCLRDTRQDIHTDKGRWGSKIPLIETWEQLTAKNWMQRFLFAYESENCIAIGFQAQIK